MAGTDFYRTLTEVSFTLLGLWFTVLRLAHGEWRGAVRHRFTVHIAMHFFLPGMVGMASQLAEGAEDGGLLWRSATAVAGVIGFVESVTLRFPDDAGAPPPGWRLRVIDPVLYLAMVVVAVLPAGLTVFAPLQLAGAVTGVLFLLGLCVAWLAFIEPESAVAPDAETAPVPVGGAEGVGAEGVGAGGVGAEEVTARVELAGAGGRPRTCRFSYLCTNEPAQAPALRCGTCPARA